MRISEEEMLDLKTRLYAKDIDGALHVLQRIEDKAYNARLKRTVYNEYKRSGNQQLLEAYFDLKRRLD